ncbi:MAG: hypothetical protein WAT43_15765 [Chitinophagales bacterium]|nr:hypothetical protein [Bacteroidota bacterium]
MNFIHIKSQWFSAIFLCRLTFIVLYSIALTFLIDGCTPNSLNPHTGETAGDKELPPWDTTEKYLLGIRANDPVNRNLRMDWFVEDYGDEWSLLMPTKQNLGGVLKRYSTNDAIAKIPSYERDLAFNIQPFTPFKFLYDVAVNNNDIHSDSSVWETKEGEDRTYFKTIHCEITPQFTKYLYYGSIISESNPGFFYDNPWFGLTGNYDYGIPKSIGLDDTICTYGPFVSDDIEDEHHACRPEIHPAQQIWFKDKLITDHKAYWLFFFQDQSDRFWDTDDVYYILSEDLPSYIRQKVPADSQNVFRPWAKSPVYGQYQILFHIKPQNQVLNPSQPMIINLSVAQEREVVTAEFPTMVADVNEGFVHSYYVGGEELVRVTEPEQNDNDMGIQFVEVTKLSDGSYVGFVQISMVLGDGDDDTGTDNLSGNGAGYIVLHADIYPYHITQANDLRNTLNTNQ